MANRWKFCQKCGARMNTGRTIDVESEKYPDKCTLCERTIDKEKENEK